MATNSAKLSFGEIEVYDSDALKNRSEKELREEYTRLRDIAQKRLKRMRDSEFVKSETYAKNSGRFPKLQNISSEAQLRKKLSDLARFVDAKTSTVSGLKHQRNEAIKTLHKNGYDYVNAKNFNDFINLLEQERSTERGKRYGSPTPEEVETKLKEKEKENLSSEEMKEKLDEYKKRNKELEEELKEYKKKPYKHRRTSKDFEEAETKRRRGYRTK